MGERGHGSEGTKVAEPGASPKPRSRAFLITLLGLLWGSVACIALLLGSAMDLEATYADASSALATPRRPRAARPRALPGSPALFDAGAALAPGGVPRFGASGFGGPRGPFALASADPALRPSSRHLGGRPHLATPQGRRLYEALAAAARTEKDPARRAGAARSLAAIFGRERASAGAAWEFGGRRLSASPGIGIAGGDSDSSRGR